MSSLNVQLVSVVTETVPETGDRASFKAWALGSLVSIRCPLCGALVLWYWRHRRPNELCDECHNDLVSMVVPMPGRPGLFDDPRNP
jgi:hypothetical protein